MTDFIWHFNYCNMTQGDGIAIAQLILYAILSESKIYLNLSFNYLHINPLPSIRNSQNNQNPCTKV